MRNAWWKAAMASLALSLAVPAFAGDVSFKDPTGDDNGPGTYTYPTDTVYKKGSFDLTGLDVKMKGDKVEFSVGTNVALAPMLGFDLAAYPNVSRWLAELKKRPSFVKAFG